MPAILNFTKKDEDLKDGENDAGMIYQGETKSYEIDLATVNPVAPIDLTNVTEIKAELRPRRGSDDVLATWEYNQQISKVNAPGLDGKIRIDLSATHTDGYNFEQAVYDMKFTFSDPKVRVYLEGTIKVRQKVTA